MSELWIEQVARQSLRCEGLDGGLGVRLFIVQPDLMTSSNASEVASLQLVMVYYPLPGSAMFQVLKG